MKRSPTDGGFRPPPLRRQLGVALAGTALFCSLAIGALGLDAAYDSARDEAIRTTGMVADQKYAELRLLLLLREERTRLTLEHLVSSCNLREDLARDGCVEHVLTDMVAILNADGVAVARLGKTWVVGRPFEVPARSGERPSAQRPGAVEARFGRDGERFLFVTAVSADGSTTLTARFGMTDVDAIFAAREHLGRSGESFLADPNGFFLTPGRYQSEQGTSHPIHARPMQKCLAGHSGEVLDLDYRDMPIIHGFRFVPEVGGGCIMAHIDQEEAFAPAKALLARLLLLGSILAASATALSLVLADRLARPIDRLLMQLARAVRVRDDFLSIASHELKNPLSAILLRLGVSRRRLNRGLAAESAVAELDELLKLLERQIPRLNTLIEDVLNAAALEHGALTITPVRANLTQTVQEAVSKMSLPLSEAGIDVTMAPAPAVLCAFDASRIEQVLLNLFSNAIKYASGKPLEVRVEADAVKATVVVRDHGPGIPPEKQAVIFERFERAGAPGVMGGLGLGLYISRHLAEAHGGALRVTSALGEGTTFLLELPLSGPGDGGPPVMAPLEA